MSKVFVRRVDKELSFDSKEALRLLDVAYRAIVNYDDKTAKQILGRFLNEVKSSGDTFLIGSAENAIKGERPSYIKDVIRALATYVRTSAR